jgi:hypothetical protein
VKNQILSITFLFVSFALLAQQENKVKDYSQYDIYQRAELQPDFKQAWSIDSIHVKVNTSKCQTFKIASNGNIRTWSNISVEIANNTGRDLVYTKQQTVDISIRHLAEWDNKLFNTAVDGSREIDIVITKQVIKGNDTTYVFPKGLTWTFDKTVTLLIPEYRKINKASNYYAEYKGCSKPYTPQELEILDFEKEKKGAFLKAKFKSVDKLDQKNGRVTLQFDIPLLKKYQLYINNELIGEFKRGDYYEFEFASNQKITIKTTTKKASSADINKEIEFRTGYSYFYVIHAHTLTGSMKELFDDYITLINPNFIPKFLEDNGVTKTNFTPPADRLTTGKTMP